MRSLSPLSQSLLSSVQISNFREDLLTCENLTPPQGRANFTVHPLHCKLIKSVNAKYDLWEKVSVFVHFALILTAGDFSSTVTHRAHGEEKKKRLHVLTALILFFFSR